MPVGTETALGRDQRAFCLPGVPQRRTSVVPYEDGYFSQTSCFLCSSWLGTAPDASRPSLACSQPPDCTACIRQRAVQVQSLTAAPNPSGNTNSSIHPTWTRGTDCICLEFLSGRGEPRRGVDRVSKITNGPAERLQASEQP